jgi:uncharacterized damage-inducible protein DinB
MIGPGFAQTMACYNRWQDRSLYAAADRLSEDERRMDRGAFYKSIHATLNHVLWADNMWMSPVADVPKPTVGIRNSVTFCDDWERLKAERACFDERIIAWADSLDDAWLLADLDWYSSAMKRDVVKPRRLVVTHIFNHQTHHRGQVHAMLTAAGAKPEDTDIIFM